MMVAVTDTSSCILIYIITFQQSQSICNKLAQSNVVEDIKKVE